MTVIILGVAAVLVVLPGGYLLKYVTSERFAEDYQASRNILTNRYVELLAEIFEKISSETTASGVTAKDLLSGGSYIGEIKEVGKILATRSQVGGYLRKLFSISLYCRITLFILVLILLSALVTNTIQVHTNLVIVWWILITIFGFATLVLLFTLFIIEHRFIQQTHHIRYGDEGDEIF